MAISTQAAVPATRPAARESAARPRAPRVDIFETDTAYVLLADVPGVRPDGLEVVAERDSLTIRARVEEQPTFDYYEFELGDYYRSFTLTEDLDPDKVVATLRDGVVRIEIGKSEHVKPRKIPVRTE